MEIELTAQAEADLVEIGDFIAKDNPSAAERYVRRLRDRIAAPITRTLRPGGTPARGQPKNTFQI